MVTSVGRWAFLALTWLFLAGLVVQVFMAGMAFFANSSWELHIGLGWTLHLAPLLILLAAVVGRVGRGPILVSIGLVVTVGVQPFLPGLRSTFPLAAALHPVNALLIFWLTTSAAIGAIRLLWRPVAVPEGTSATPR